MSLIDGYMIGLYEGFHLLFVPEYSDVELLATVFVLLGAIRVIHHVFGVADIVIDRSFFHDSILLRFRRFISLRFKRSVVRTMALRTHPRIWDAWCPGPVTAYACECGEFNHG
jgi:hypothetical protein